MKYPFLIAFALLGGMSASMPIHAQNPIMKTQQMTTTFQNPMACLFGSDGILLRKINFMMEFKNNKI